MKWLCDQNFPWWLGFSQMHQVIRWDRLTTVPYKMEVVHVGLGLGHQAARCLHNWLMIKVALVAGKEDIHGLNPIGSHLLKLALLGMPLNIQTASDRDQHCVLNMATSLRKSLSCFTASQFLWTFSTSEGAHCEKGYGFPALRQEIDM